MKNFGDVFQLSQGHGLTVALRLFYVTRPIGLKAVGAAAVRRQLNLLLEV